MGTSAPAGMTTFGAAGVAPLQPGMYRVEGWGRPSTGGEPQRYFTRDFAVSSEVPVIEYYSEALDHYFLSAGADEIALLDRGAQGDWKRTGQRFKAWARASDAPVMAQPVCRFYARGPNSHFYTGDKAECDFLKGLEQRQRAESNAKGTQFLGWQYEGIAFYAVVPQANVACPAGMLTVYRAYNNRAAQMDSNHRFTVTGLQRAAMTMTWADEGPALCSPQ
jgi:hypothetical protein